MKKIYILGGPMDGTLVRVPDDANKLMVLGDDGDNLILDICDNGHAHWEYEGT